MIGYGFSQVTPSQHLFSLTDADISYPYIEDQTVSTETLILTGLFAPAVIIMIGALLLVPGSAGSDGARSSKSQIVRRRIWEWNAGWMGLAVALAGVWMSTEGLKDLVGRPRPDLLSRCNPDLSAISANARGGLGGRLRDAPLLVSWKICRDQSSRVVVDGFSSFPSGHSSCMFHLSSPTGARTDIYPSRICRPGILVTVDLCEILHWVSLSTTVPSRRRSLD